MYDIINYRAFSEGTPLAECTQSGFKTWEEACDVLKERYYPDGYVPKSENDARFMRIELNNLYGLGFIDGYVVQQV